MAHNFDDPLTLYKSADGAPTETRIVHSAKQYSDAKAAGFTEYTPLRYPLALYAADGSHVVANSEAEEKEKLALGFSLDAIAKPAPVPHIEGDPGAFERLNALENSMREILRRLPAVPADEDTAPTKPAKPAKPAKGEAA